MVHMSNYFEPDNYIPNKSFLYSIFKKSKQDNIIEKYNTLTNFYKLNTLSPGYQNENNFAIVFDKEHNTIFRINKIIYVYGKHNELPKFHYVGYIVSVFYIDKYKIKENNYVYLDIKSADTVLNEIEAIFKTPVSGGMRSNKTIINKKTHKINKKLIHKAQFYKLKSKYNKNIKQKRKTKQNKITS